jgi:putative endonuclease
MTEFRDRAKDLNNSAVLTGAEAEELACQHLQDQGLSLLKRNFRTKRGEIDLIMQDKSCVVFVEVRFRRSSRFGSAEESINSGKCRRLNAAAMAYLQQSNQGENAQARFDAVAISPNSRQPGNFAINWLQNILT